MSDLPERISLREVGPRDGLQNEDPVPTAAKVELINTLAQTGVSRIEAVSYVRPEAIPQMADADQVWQGITWEHDLLLFVPAVFFDRHRVGIDDHNAGMPVNDQRVARCHFVGDVLQADNRRNPHGVRDDRCMTRLYDPNRYKIHGHFQKYDTIL